MADLKQFDFRAASKREMPDYHRIVRYVFGRDPEEEQKDEDDPMRPEWTWVAVHRGKIVATSGGYPFVMRLNGRDVQVDGVSDVGTEPGFRRRGLVRRLITDRLRAAYEKEIPAAVLYASFGAIYQRFGYGLASKLMYCNFDPRFAEFQFGERSQGVVRRYSRDEAQQICPSLYDRFIEDRSIVMRRNSEMWKFAIPKKTYCAVHFNAEDEPDGYLTYTNKEFRRTTGPFGEMPGEPDPDQRLAICDFVWTDVNAYRGLWEFVRAHDLAGSVTYAAPLDDPAWSLLMEPRVLRPVLQEGIWLRVVSAKALLESREYDGYGSVRLQIDGDVDCPWNNGTLELQVDGNQARTRKTNGTGDVRIDPHGLASLLSGQQSLSQLVRIGRAEVDGPARLPSLDALFKTRYAPFCMTDF